MRTIIFSALKCCLPHHRDRRAAGPKQMLPDYLMIALSHKHLLSARSLGGREASTVWARLVGMLPLCNSIQWLPTLTGNSG